MASKGTPSAAVEDPKELVKVLESCLSRRIPAEKWEKFTRQLLAQTTSKVFLADLLLDETRLSDSLLDPLYPGYVSRALSCQLLSPLDVLVALSKAIRGLQPGQQIARYPLLRVMSQAILVWRPSIPPSENEITLLWNIEQILHQFVSDEVLGQDNVLFIEAMETWTRLLNSVSIRPLFKIEKDRNTDLWQSFENDIQHLRGAAATKVVLPKAHGFETTYGDFIMDMTTTTNGVTAPLAKERPKIHVFNTRAALMMLLISWRESINIGATDYIWNTIERLADGSSGREIFANVIQAAFDALALVLKRTDLTISTYPEPLTEVSLYQSILVNRIPALLAARRDQYSVPLDELEYSMLEIFTKIDPILMNLNVPAIPNLDGEEDELSLPTKDFRQDFMYAIVKHSFLDPEAPSRILGIQIEEIPNLIDKTEIIEEAGDMMDEEGAVERIVERLNALDGNQSITVTAILELVQMWIEGHNIHALAILCSCLMKDTTLIDQFFLHTTISKFIEPLREFLDTWTIDEDDDNVEFQLIYEQYNSILFLVCYCIHHYGRHVALENPDGSGFVRTWLREFSRAKWLDMLSDEDSNAIGTWITALFDGDGISDDLVSPPYKWLLISTTLFQQSVMAYRQGVLQLKTLKDGFEYFMQPFLEPCLLGAINYLNTQLKTSTPETILSYLEILSCLLEFLSPAQQDDDIFSTLPLQPKTSRVLQILSPSLVSTISQLSLDQTQQVKHLLDPIVETLRPYSSQLRPEITSNHKDALATLRGTLSGLAQWSGGWGSGFVVPAQVDLRWLATAVKLCGKNIVIRCLVDEMAAADTNYGDHAVVVAGMFLTVPYEIGFGREILGEKFLVMVPGETKQDGTGLGLGRSLGPLTELVKRIVGWEDDTAVEEKGEEMVLD